MEPTEPSPATVELTPPPPVPILCAGPGPHDPDDGVVGWATDLIVPAGSPALVNGTVCASPACHPIPPSEPVDLAGLLDAITNATSLTDLQERLSQEPQP